MHDAAANHFLHEDLVSNPSTRLGFLVPPGNPTTEPEMFRLAPADVSVHFTRMNASGETGSHLGQEARNLSQIAHLDEDVRRMALVFPKVIVMAHTASSYTLGRQAEAELIQRLSAQSGVPFITAFGSVMAALSHLSIARLAVGTPYGPEWTARGRAHLEAHGIEVVDARNLENVRNIYDETPQRAMALVRSLDTRHAQAVFLSGVGMPTLDVLQPLEDELGLPVLSSASAMMWNALRIAGVSTPVTGFGRLLSQDR